MAAEDEFRRKPDPEEFRIGSQRDNQYTPMGEVAMVGDFAAGLASGRAWIEAGWRRNVAITGVVLLVVTVVLALVDFLLNGSSYAGP